MIAPPPRLQRPPRRRRLSSQHRTAGTPRLRLWTSALLAVSLGLAAPVFASEADDHLRSGAAHFRSGHFAEALVEFEVAQKLGAGDEARAYAGAALVKLERAEEALEAFAELRGRPADPLIDFYRALACYQAKLYTCADQLFADVEAHGGPRLAGEASRSRALLAPVLRAEPPSAAVDAYLARAEALSSQGHRSLALLFWDEARATAHRRADCHGCQQAEAALTRSRTPEPERTR